MLRRLLVLLALAGLAVFVLVRRKSARAAVDRRHGLAQQDRTASPSASIGLLVPPPNASGGAQDTGLSTLNAPTAVELGPRADVTVTPPEPGRVWVPPVDGACPPGYPVKVSRSGIYHVPGGAMYLRTVPERCYATAAAAQADGYRASKR